MPTKQAWSSSGAKWSEEAPRWPPSVAVDQVFGSWSEFRRELTGVIYNAPWSRDQVLDAICRYHRLHGRAPAKNAWEVGAPPDYPSSATVQRLFGTFTAAIREAGFTPAGEAARRAAPRT